MNYIIIILVLLGAFFLTYHFIQYRKSVGKSEGFALRKIIMFLLIGFTTIAGFSTIFADFAYNLLGIPKPLYFELYPLFGYLIFAVSTVYVIKYSKTKSEAELVQKGHANQGQGDNINVKSSQNVLVNNKLESGAQIVINSPSKPEKKKS